MPLQNRVNPRGEIEINSARGHLMGNRGVLHNSKKALVKPFKNKAWITCLLEFKGRSRQLMSPNQYTELFFYDEVTAFAAGHRPCAECRRARYNEFKEAWSLCYSSSPAAKISVKDIDEILHSERIENENKLTWKSPLQTLPHGTMFQLGSDFYAVYENGILKWSYEGYQPVCSEKLPDEVDVLTPESIVLLFAKGFKPEFRL